MTKALGRVKNGDKILFTVDGFEALEVDFKDFTPEIKHHLGIHGMSQKVGDSAAGKRGQEAYNSIKVRIDALKAGKWSEAKESSPKIAATPSTLEELMSGLDPEQAEKLTANFAALVARQAAAKASK